MGRGTQNLLSTWVPLGNVPLEQGPLAILEKSHLLPQLRSSYCQLDVDRDELWNKFRFKHGAFVREGKYSANPRAVQQEFKRRWLTTGFRATDMLVFSPYLLHCSLDNVSNRIRLTADTRYQLLSEPYDERWVGNPPVGHRNALWFLRNRN
jgi:ectoine hydroxylase-related dioxygenase (phytanoyl-CoA dioxygenase family)